MVSESRRLAMRRAHARRESYCSCGKIVYGNGGRYAHAAMHERTGDGHHYLTATAWENMQRDRAKEQDDAQG